MLLGTDLVTQLKGGEGGWVGGVRNQLVTGVVTLPFLNDIKLRDGGGIFKVLAK